MHFPCISGERPESMQALYPGVDSCSYPKISIDDPSSSSSSSGEVQEPVQIKPRRSGPKDKGRLQHLSGILPGSSPAPSPESQENEEEDDRAEQEGHFTASTLSQSPHLQRTESRAGGRDTALDGSESAEEECSTAQQDRSSQALDSSWASLSHHSPGVNGQPRTEVQGRGNLGQNLLGSSESEGETKVRPADTRTQAEEQASQRGQAQGALKRTHLGLGEMGSEASPSEKKFKT